MKVKFLDGDAEPGGQFPGSSAAPQKHERRRVVASALFASAFFAAGCSMIPFTSQHPSFAMNSGTCAALGPAIAALVTVSPMGISSAAMLGKALCDAESSVVAGQPAQITETTTTLQGVTKMTP